MSVIVEAVAGHGGLTPLFQAGISDRSLGLSLVRGFDRSRVQE